MEATYGGSAAELPSASCRVRGVLGRIGDKWAIYVVDRLGDGPRRFSELLRGIDGITARMLTVTLRGLERDGVLTRTVHAAVPPRVDYALTPLGGTRPAASGPRGAWADPHPPATAAAQVAYDGHAEDPPCQQEAAAG